MGQKILINVEPEDIRVAILEEGILTDLFIESRHEKSIVGDIYKGIVTDVVPGIQAAFIDIAGQRNAFLHVQDIPPAEGDVPIKVRGRRRRTENGSGNGKKMNIADYLKPGQKIMVQAIKDGIGDKGPRVSQFISLPGRYMVLLPNQAEDDAGGVSRRIEDSQERARLRRIMETLDPEEGSLILRTAAVDQADDGILADVAFLKRLWERVKAKHHTAKAPALLHSDYNILYRLVRDVFTDAIDEIAIDHTAEHSNLVKMLKQYVPKLRNRVLLYPSTRNIFEVFDIERQVYKALRKRVWLRSGGHLVFDECEALTAIDVNTGKFIGKEDQEATVLRTNQEAARVIARQLKLRDIGGIIVIDFIDMVRREHREEVLRDLKRCLRLDRARTTASEFTSLGTIEMTRKRVRHSLRKTLLRECPHCAGNGMILSNSSIWRLIRNAVLSLIEDHPDHDIRVLVHPELLAAAQDHHRKAFAEIEDEHGIEITLAEGETLHQEHHVLEARPSGTPLGQKGKAKDVITVTAKRFSTPETDAAASAKTPRRRRGRAGGRRPDQDPALSWPFEEDVEPEQEVAAVAEETDEPAEIPEDSPGDEAVLLEGESLSGRLTSRALEETAAQEMPRPTRRRSRGGRGRGRRRRRPEETVASEGADAETLTGSADEAEAGGPGTADEGFTAVEQYLGEDAEGEAAVELPERSDGAATTRRRPRGKRGGARRRSSSRRKTPKQVAAKSEPKKTAKRRGTTRRRSAQAKPKTDRSGTASEE
jgi:ribonuclease G